MVKLPISNMKTPIWNKTNDFYTSLASKNYPPLVMRFIIHNINWIDGTSNYIIRLKIPYLTGLMIPAMRGCMQFLFGLGSIIL